MSYILGVVCADGCLVEHSNGYHCLNITSKDFDWLHMLKQTLQAEQKICPKGTAYQLQIRNQSIYGDLLSLGATPRKSKTLQMPFVPLSVLADFSRGYFDGDGTVWFRRDMRWKNSWHMKAAFYSGSYRFLEMLRIQLQQCAALSPGALMSLPTVFELRYCIKDAMKLYYWMYYDHHVLCLPRKRQRFEQFLQTRQKMTN